MDELQISRTDSSGGFHRRSSVSCKCLHACCEWPKLVMLVSDPRRPRALNMAVQN